MAFTGRESHGNRSRPGTDRDRRSRDQPSLARRIVRATSARWRLAYTVASRRLRRGLAYAPLNLAPHGSYLSIIQEAQRPGPSWLLQRRSRWPPVSVLSGCQPSASSAPAAASPTPAYGSLSVATRGSTARVSPIWPSASAA